MNKILFFIIFISIVTSCDYFSLLSKDDWDDLNEHQNQNQEEDESLLEGLIAYYKLDGNAIDSSNNSNNGIIVGDATSSGIQNRFGEVGRAMTFDGTDDYIDTYITSGFAISFTLSSWIYSANYTNGAFKPIMSKQAGDPPFGISGNGSAEFNLQVNDVGRMEIFLGGGSNYTTVIMDYLTDDNWYHVAVAVNGYTVTTYLNGNIMNTANIPSRVYSNLNFQIGRYINNSGTQFFDGTIDEVFVYNRVLNDSEIQRLYNGDYDF